MGDSADDKDRVIVKKNGPVHIAYYKAQESSVRLDTGGSGFFISGDGLIATAAHAVPVGQSRVIADTVDGTAYIAEMISRDVSNDLALLKVIKADRLKDFPFLKLNTRDAFGEELAATGHPNRWPSVYISMGKALEKPYRTSYPAWKDSNDLLRMTAHVIGGNSGGAVVDFAGDVRGVLVGSQGSGLAVVVPSKNVENLLKWTERAARGKIDHEGGYSLAAYEIPVGAKKDKPADAGDAIKKPLPKLVLPNDSPRPEQKSEEKGKLPDSKEQKPQPMEQGPVLPESFKIPGAGSYKSPYGKVVKDPMNYYEHKKIQEERKPLPGGDLD